MKKIAVIGATGMLGIPVVEELTNAGFQVTALVRDPDSARKRLPAGTNVVTADAADIASLKNGLAGHDAVYLSLSVSPSEKTDDFHTEAEGLDNILTAARACGIKRVGYLSAMVQDGESNDWWVIDVWRSALARIKGSGLPYTIFYPSNFMETLQQRHVAGRLLTMIGRSRHPNYWIAANDFGKQVAASFKRDQSANREYFVQGPQALTYDEAGRAFARHTSPHLTVVRIPLSAIKLLGAFSQTMDFNYKIMNTVLSYPETFKAEETWKELGKPLTTIEQFARSSNKPAKVS
ncbi:MAG: NAD(P)H-binding protein [Hyphomicrobiaceae bacterium]